MYNKDSHVKVGLPLMRTLQTRQLFAGMRRPQVGGVIGRSFIPVPRGSHEDWQGYALPVGSNLLMNVPGGAQE